MEIEALYVGREVSNETFAQRLEVARRFQIQGAVDLGVTMRIASVKQLSGGAT